MAGKVLIGLGSVSSLKRPKINLNEVNRCQKAEAGRCEKDTLVLSLNKCLLFTPGRQRGNACFLPLEGGDAPPPSPILLEMVCGYTMVQVLQAVHVVDKHCW